MSRIKNERQRKKRANETPEEKEIRLRNTNEYLRKKKAKETPEEIKPLYYHS